VDVRLVAATNRGLRAQVAARRFREDLFFRLSVFPITVPPLRERKGDIAVLARYFVERFCRDLKKETLGISPEAQEHLERYHWPGNVRELQNCIERAVILSDGDIIQPRQLSLSFVTASNDVPEPVDPWASFDLSGSLNEVARRGAAEAERRKIQQVLEQADRDKGRASELLGITYKAFISKLKEHHLQ
jgi:transcriptional regulator with GAF, ATPase, and Fis domain